MIRARLKDSPSHAAYIKTLMSRRDAAVDIEVPVGSPVTEAAIVRLRQEQAPDTALLAVYAIDAVSPTNRKLREPLNAATDASGSESSSRSQPRATKTRSTGKPTSRASSRVADDYLEEDDLGALEEEQL